MHRYYKKASSLWFIERFRGSGGVCDGPSPTFRADDLLILARLWCASASPDNTARHECEVHTLSRVLKCRGVRSNLWRQTVRPLAIALPVNAAPYVPSPSTWERQHNTGRSVAFATASVLDDMYRQRIQQQCILRAQFLAMQYRYAEHMRRQQEAAFYMRCAAAVQTRHRLEHISSASKGRSSDKALGHDSSHSPNRLRSDNLEDVRKRLRF